MHIAPGNFQSVARFFHEELGHLYPAGEIKAFIAICFEEYLGLGCADVVLMKNEKINEADLARLGAAVKELKEGKPMQYIIGKADFCGMKFFVDKNVLIPRPETEELVDWIKSKGERQKAKDKRDEERKEQPGNAVLLDVGTGSGCIAIALKIFFPGAEVHALDNSAEALKLARQNAELNNAEINLIHDDILKPSALQPFRYLDIIVSNPPYIRHSERKMLHKNVLDYEPHGALFVDDEDALLFYRAICDFANRYLNPGGMLFFEINEVLGAEVKQLMEKKGFGSVEVKKDLSGKERMAMGKYRGRT